MQNQIRTILSVLIIMALLLGGSLPFGEQPAAADDGERQDLPPIELPEKGNPKLDSQLNRLVSAQTSRRAASFAQESNIELVDGNVRVIVESLPDQVDATAKTASALGVVETSYRDLLQVVVPVSQLMALADTASIRLVRLPWYPLAADNVSEGVALINADEWQAAGYNGTGVKVAILDSGFTGYSSLLGTELPASVTTQSFYAGSNIEGYTTHGTACAEIVYDIAPDADFYLVNFGTDVEWGNAVDWLINTAEVDIISHSIVWFPGGPGDGTGTICEVVDDARNAGILWSQAMGNYAQRHWQGDFADTEPDGWHNFSVADEGNTISVNNTDTIIVVLKWDDTWGSSGNDYDLYLFDSSSPYPVAWSNWPQDGDDDPWEGLSYTANYTGSYGIAIDGYYATAPANFHLFCYRHDLQYQVASSSLAVPADSANATAVGAVPWNNPTALEPFSSQGPTTDNRTKPDLVAPDGVSTATYGATDFYGTSASAPHVAGAAVLVKELYPSYTPAQIQSFLEGRAFDLGAAGKDNLFGSGRLDLGSPPPTMEPIVEAEGQYYNTAPVLSNFGFDDDEALDDGWYQMDSYTGSWTALFTDNGSTSWDYDNWPIPDFGALSEGSHTIYFKASDNATNVVGDAGEWNWQFYKDTAPPTDPTSVNSTSHTISVWSSDNTVSVNWTDATDNLSGLDGYSILWNISTNTTPSANKTIEEGSENTTSPELAEDNSHYFHIRSVDNAGNWQSTVHLGPFYIDTTPPTDPTSVNSTSHTISVWSSDNTVSVNWTDATDNLSGLDGYSILWNTSANTTPSVNKTIEEGSKNTTSPELAEDNSHYFHIRSKDNAGNWQSTVHLGPFFIDATPPTIETIAEAEGQYHTTAPSFSNFGFDDGVALDDGWYQLDSFSGNWTTLFTDVAVTDILDIAVASDNTTIYAATGTSNLYRSTNAGVTWSTTSVIADNTTMDADLVAVAPDNENYVAVADATSPKVYVSDNISAYWDTLGAVTGIDTINDLALSVETGGNHFVAVAGEDGGVAEVWYYEVGGYGAVWTEASAGSGFDAGNVAAAVAFSPNFASDNVMVAITEEDDGAGGTDNVSFQIYRLLGPGFWNSSGAFDDYPVTIASDDGITGLDSASISLAPDYHGAWDTRRDVFVGLTVAGDNDAAATSGIYRLNDDNVTALKTGVTTKTYSVAYDGTNLVAGAYDTTNVWRSADPMAATPTVNVTSAMNRPGGDDKVVVAWAGSDVVAATSGNQSAFAVSTDNGETFNDILVITDISWDNDGWTIPGFDALANGSHTIYFKASDDIGNIEGESGEWGWQFNKGSPPSNGGGGGGGGGGGAAGVTPILNFITQKGRFVEDVTCKSEDKKVELYIPENTIGLNRVGSLISSIRIKQMEESPTPPEQTDVIGLVYDIDPFGATFDPPIDLTIKYDESKIPEGVAEKNLVVAWWDKNTSQWVELESTVDPENDTVTAKVSHFTAFTILAYTRPASFTVTDLSLTPGEVNLGERVSVSVIITNNGDLTGSYELSLEIDNTVVQTKEVTLDGGDSETISFSVTPDAVGEHTVNVSGLPGTLKVKAPEAPPAPTPVPAVAPAPASFVISDFSVTPSEVKLAEQVKISAVVTNTGGSEGSYTVLLQINGAEEAKKEVALGAGKSETVTFTIAKDTEGSYAVTINGKVGQFNVIVPPPPTPTPTEALPVQPPTNWWLIGGIFAGCVVVAAGLLVYFFVWRKRGAARPSQV